MVGPSGSGKSTLARLLYRFYDIQEGHIRIGGQDIRSVTQSSLRQAIGIVPQDTVLFNDTIAYNIAYGRPGATHEECGCREGGAHRRLHRRLAAGLRDRWASVGSNCRGREAACGHRAHAAQGPADSHLRRSHLRADSANERAIQAEPASASRNKTTLVIAHRLSTVVDAHEILVLEAGVIKSSATMRAQLLAMGGRYAQMWAPQKVDAAPML